MKFYLNTKLYAVCFFVATVFLTSCHEEALRGKGDIVSRSRPVGNFAAISAGGKFEIYLTQGSAADLMLEGQENVLTEVSTQVRNNTLFIELEKKWFRINKPVRIYITNPQLTALSVSGSSSVRSLTDWQVHDLNLDFSGNSSVHLNVKNAQTIDSRLSGSVDMELNGDAVHHDLDISGSGNIKAFDLSTKTAAIALSGSGRCEVMVSERLEANLSGSGQVRYKGSPTVNTKISGSGSVKQAN